MGPGADRLLQAARNMRQEIAKNWRYLNDKEETPFTRIAGKIADNFGQKQNSRYAGKFGLIVAAAILSQIWHKIL